MRRQLGRDRHPLFYPVLVIDIFAAPSACWVANLLVAEWWTLRRRTDRDRTARPEPTLA